MTKLWRLNSHLHLPASFQMRPMPTWYMTDTWTTFCCLQPRWWWRLIPTWTMNLIKDNLLTRYNWKNWAELKGLLTLLQFWVWPYSYSECDPTPILRMTLLLFWGWPYSQSEGDPTPNLRLTLLPIWGWPYSQYSVYPTLTLLCTYSAPTRHLLCTYSQIKSRIPTFYQSFSPCPRGRIIKMHHVDFPSLLLVYYICCHSRDPFCIIKIPYVTLVNEVIK